MLVSKKKYEKALVNIKGLEKVISAKSEKIEKLTEELESIEKRLNKEFNDERAIAYKTMELEFQGQYLAKEQKIKDEYQGKMNKGIEDNFNKLKDSLATLHEEGNANTKYLEKMSISIMENFGKSQATALGYNKPSPKDE